VYNIIRKPDAYLQSYVKKAINELIKRNKMNLIIDQELSPNKLRALSSVINSYTEEVLNQYFNVEDSPSIAYSGYNEQEGNIYLTLEDGISIICKDYDCNNVSYLVQCGEAEVEAEFNTYSEARAQVQLNEMYRSAVNKLNKVK
jgi:hypothetical protein